MAHVLNGGGLTASCAQNRRMREGLEGHVKPRMTDPKMNAAPLPAAAVCKQAVSGGGLIAFQRPKCARSPLANVQSTSSRLIWGEMHFCLGDLSAELINSHLVSRNNSFSLADCLNRSAAGQPSISAHRSDLELTFIVFFSPTTWTSALNFKKGHREAEAERKKSL